MHRSFHRSCIRSTRAAWLPSRWICCYSDLSLGLGTAYGFKPPGSPWPCITPRLLGSRNRIRAGCIACSTDSDPVCQSCRLQSQLFLQELDQTAPPRHSLTAVIVYLCVTAVLSCLAAESLSFKAIGAEPLGDVSPQAIVLHGGWFLLEEAICGNNDQRFSTPGFRANGWYRTRVLTTNRPPVSENPANETQSLAHACCWSASAARVGSKSIPNR